MTTPRDIHGVLYDEDLIDFGPEADWYCNHDVPNGCHDCAYVKREADMLDAMTDAERREYFAAQDARWAQGEGDPF